MSEEQKTETAPQPIQSEELKLEKLDRSLLTAVLDETQRKQATSIMIEEQKFVLSQRRAKMYSMSGLFADKDIPPGSEVGVARAMVKIELGASMGFAEAEALQGIYVINGQTCVASALRAGRMQSAGYDWDVAWHGTEDECTGVTLWMKYQGKPMMVPVRNEKGEPLKNDAGELVTQQARSSFKKVDAQRMLTTMWVEENGKNVKKRVSILEKDNWKMSGRNMYFARAVTNAQRFFAPKVMSANLMSVEEAIDLESVIDETELRRTAVLPPAGTKKDAAEEIQRRKEELRREASPPEARKTEQPPSEEVEKLSAQVAKYESKMPAESYQRVIKKHLEDNKVSSLDEIQQKNDQGEMTPQFSALLFDLEGELAQHRESQTAPAGKGDLKKAGQQKMNLK